MNPKIKHNLNMATWMLFGVVFILVMLIGWMGGKVYDSIKQCFKKIE